MLIRNLDSNDLPASRELLAANDLPIDDLDDRAIELVGAFIDSRMVGVIGLQRCGELALLRSLAVDSDHRDRRIAQALCEHVFARAAELGTPLWLLTMTAERYFARYGFVAVPRDQVPTAIRATAQFGSLCPASAHVMTRVATRP